MNARRFMAIPEEKSIYGDMTTGSGHTSIGYPCNRKYDEITLWTFNNELTEV